MNYVSAGRGAPPLVFVHGFACTHEDWAPQLAHFGTTQQVVACDLRAHGATPGRAAECSIENYGGDVAALVNNLELQGCILVGHSMGCRVVLEAARINPDPVAGLVLVDGSRQASGDPEQAEAGTRTAIESVGFPAFIDGAFRQMFLQCSPQAVAILARAKRLPADVGAALWPRMARWDAQYLDAALAAVRAPLMVIQSTCIDASRRRAALAPGQTTPWLDLVRARVPGARIEVIPGVGHFTQLEAADEVNRLITALAVSSEMK